MGEDLTAVVAAAAAAQPDQVATVSGAVTRLRMRRLAAEVAMADLPRPEWTIQMAQMDHWVVPVQPEMLEAAVR